MGPPVSRKVVVQHFVLRAMLKRSQIRCNGHHTPRSSELIQLLVALSYDDHTSNRIIYHAQYKTRGCLANPPSESPFPRPLAAQPTGWFILSFAE